MGQVAVVVPGRALSRGIGHGPALFGVGHDELHLADVIAAQHVLALGAAAKAIAARREGDALLIALFGN